MVPNAVGRRTFVKGLGAVLALSVTPTVGVFGQTLSKRLDWDTFKTTDYYPAFVRGIAAMRDNTDASDRRSWQFWINAHLNYRPHGVAYFLAWHRGCLYYFEQYLRFVSGNKALMVPYWDYYKNPVLPAEFTDPSPRNPLYVDRLNTNVRQALTLAPFSDTQRNFERGTLNSFELGVERNPHDPVHDIIGAAMATTRSSQDPIFWLHHANIDRLWVAWVAAGHGRQMPAPDAPYWRGQFDYGPGLSMSRNLTYSTRDQMAYFYENELLPAALPSAVNTSSAVTTQKARQGFITRPPEAAPESALQRAASDGQRTGGGAKNLRLDEKSVSVRIPVSEPDREKLHAIIAAIAAKPTGSTNRSGGAAGVPTPTATIEVVLDNVRLTAAGERGGYYHNLYLNMPASASGDLLEKRHFLGSLGAFAIAGALHQAGRHGDHGTGPRSTGAGAALLDYPATAVLAGLPRDELRHLMVSFVRVGGDRTPTGEVITIGEVRIAVAGTGVH